VSESCLLLVCPGRVLRAMIAGPVTILAGVSCVQEPNYARYIAMFEPIVNTPERPLQIDTALKSIVGITAQCQDCCAAHCALIRPCMIDSWFLYCLAAGGPEAWAWRV
jgi:hypothetical protein